MKKLLCLLLALLIIVLTACSDAGSNEETKDTASTVSENVEEQEEETAWIDTVPSDIKYDGYKFNIGWKMVGCDDEYSPVYDDVAGDLVGEAVHTRNLQTEAKLDITIGSEELAGSWTDSTTTVKNLVLAGDTTYDVIVNGTWFMFTNSINGLLTPIDNVKTLDMSNIWWDSVMNKMTTLGSKTHFMLNGHINYVDDYACSVLYFNKALCTRLGLDMPYELVRNGDWTLDKFIEYMNASSNDEDGDGDYDENDLWGLVENSGTLVRFLPAFKTNAVVIDENGIADVNSDESFATQMDKMYNQILTRENHALLLRDREIGYEKGDLVFPGGRALFFGEMVRNIIGFRESMEEDFGILPYPKYDENQDGYGSSYNTVWGSSYGIPVTNLELDRTGWILETMGYYSTDTIYPASIEVNVMTKVIRDQESADMLRIVFDNKFYELGQWGTTVYGTMCSDTLKGTCNIGSFIKVASKVTQREFKEIPNYYDFSH